MTQTQATIMDEKPKTERKREFVIMLYPFYFNSGTYLRKGEILCVLPKHGGHFGGWSLSGRRLISRDVAKILLAKKVARRLEL